MKTVMLVEDDLAIRTPLSMYLESAGYRTVTIGNGLEVLPFLREQTVDIVILDINLPGRDGLSLCADIREILSVPIIMLSARGSEEDRLTAFGSGADDFVPKPFSPRELVARIATVLKRSEPATPIVREDSPSRDVRVGSLLLDSPNYRAFSGGEELKLTKTEFLLLQRLAASAGSVVGRETLMKETFGYENYLYDRTIDTHVKNVRRKIGSAATIETVRGVGYRITP